MTNRQEPTGKGPQRSEHKWRLWSWILALSAFAGALMFVWLQTQQIDDGYRLAQLQTEQRKHLEVNRKLRLTWVGLVSPGHLEQIARTRLHMKPPPSKSVVYLH